MTRLNENLQVPLGVSESLRRWLYDTMTAIARRVNGNNQTDYQLSCSDLTTALTTGTSVGYFRANKACAIKDIRATLLTASSSGAVTVDVNVNGFTILSTKLTIDQGEKTSATAATRYAISSLAAASLNDDDEVTIDIDGAGTGAKGLIVCLIVEL